MDWLNTAQQVIVLITGLVGLVSAGVGAFFAIKSVIAARKDKTFNENWKFIMQIADDAIKAAEKSGKTGADKKVMVMDAVKAGCKAAGMNLDDFIDQLSAYIDQTIKFVNDMTE